MSETNYFKEQLGDYESPLSERVSFDKVIVKTNKKAGGVRMNPKTIITAGLVLIIGTFFVGYSQNDHTDSGHSEVVASAQIPNSKISKNSSNSKAVFLASTTDIHLEKLEKGVSVERSTNSKEQISSNKLASDKTKRISGLIINQIKSIVPVPAMAKNSESETFPSKNGGIPDQEIIKPFTAVAIPDAMDDFSKEQRPQSEKEVNHSSEVEETIKSDAKPNLAAISKEKQSKESVALLEADKADSPEAKNLKKGDARPGGSGLKVEFSLISIGSNVYGQISDDAFITGSQRNFALQSLLSKEVLDKIQIGAGIGYGLNESIGKYEWMNKVEEQVITSRQQIIVQPGLPDRVVTTYDTSFTTKLENRTSDLLYKSEYVSLPLGLRYEVKDFGVFKVLASYTFEPGLLLVNSGHVFNASEVQNTSDKLSNSLVIQNKFSARLTYNLGAKWSFMLEPMYSNTYYSEKILNINNASKFGMGVGLIFNL